MTFRFCLVVAVQAKQGINEMKYPSKLNQGIVMDYKLVSLETGIDKNSASDVMCNLTGLHSMEDITGEWMDKFLVRSKAFVEGRNWCKYEQPRMLCLAMVEEVGELCGVLKFVDDKDEEVSRRVYGEVVSEICDIFIYFCRLSNLCGFFEDIKKEVGH
jgi:NTP pyrophosphatase (non-canonical NTP hydrolase)